MNHLDHLMSLIDLDGLSVVDVGAGNGKFARAFARRGAEVTGIEIDAEKVEIAKQAAHPGVRILLGRGEGLPLDDRSADVVCFMFSFHHVPHSLQEAALDETWRVLKPKARLHVVDPLPHGPMSDVLAPLDDETEVRTKSQARLDKLAEKGRFSLLSKVDYAMALKVPDFDSYVDGMIAVDPRRALKLPSVREEMRVAFEKGAKRTDDGVLVEEPCVAYHFEKVD